MIEEIGGHRMALGPYRPLAGSQVHCTSGDGSSPSSPRADAPMRTPGIYATEPQPAARGLARGPNCDRLGSGIRVGAGGGGVVGNGVGVGADAEGGAVRRGWAIVEEDGAIRAARVGSTRSARMSAAASTSARHEGARNERWPALSPNAVTTLRHGPLATRLLSSSDGSRPSLPRRMLLGDARSANRSAQARQKIATVVTGRANYGAASRPASVGVVRNAPAKIRIPATRRRAQDILHAPASNRAIRSVWRRHLAQVHCRILANGHFGSTSVWWTQHFMARKEFRRDDPVNSLASSLHNP
jgi:hypothetical protein